MPERSLDDDAIHAELIECVCDDLAAIKRALPVLLEEHLIAAAYRSARSQGGGGRERAQIDFRRVAACLRWPAPAVVAR